MAEDIIHLNPCDHTFYSIVTSYLLQYLATLNSLKLIGFQRECHWFC